MSTKTRLKQKLVPSAGYTHPVKEHIITIAPAGGEQVYFELASKDLTTAGSVQFDNAFFLPLMLGAVTLTKRSISELQDRYDYPERFAGESFTATPPVFKPAPVPPPVSYTDSHGDTLSITGNRTGTRITLSVSGKMADDVTVSIPATELIPLIRNGSEQTGMDLRTLRAEAERKKYVTPTAMGTNRAARRKNRHPKRR